jgi:hypothetical protein
MRLFIISEDQLNTLYDAMLDADLRRFEGEIKTIKKMQEVTLPPAPEPPSA